MPTNNLPTGPEREAIEYTVRRSRRRRRTMEISVDSNGAVRVAAPNHVSLADIAAFVRARAPWIEKQRKGASARAVAPSHLVDGETLLFLGLFRFSPPWVRVRGPSPRGSLLASPDQASPAVVR